MRLQFLGAGSAFTIGEDNYHSNMLLTADNGKHLLIDCGSDARFSLHEQGYSYDDIDAVYISHLHADHAGGLEWLAFTRKFNPHPSKPHLYISESSIEKLWNNVLKGGLSSLEGEIASIDMYFDVHAVKENSDFHWQGIKFHLVQTIHIMHGHTIVPSYGLFFELNGTKVFITTDTLYCPNLLMAFYRKADVIFHDCQTTDFVGGVHAHYTELVNLPEDIKNKTWLYHYNPGKKQKPKKDGFLGFVDKGQIFDY